MHIITITWNHVSECNVTHSVTLIGPDAKSVTEQLVDAFVMDEKVADTFTVICDGEDVTTDVLMSLIYSTLE